MTESFLVHTDIQKKWIRKFKKIESEFRTRAVENDIQSRFPHENIEWLIKEGYTRLTLPVEYGDEGATIEDMVILQSYSGTIDGATALSIGWYLGVIDQLYEQHTWSLSMLDSLAKEVAHGTLINRAVSEAETGSPTRGSHPPTHAVKAESGYAINGVKTFTSMSKTLTHYIVGAYVEETKSMGFFLIPQSTKGVSIADNWDMVGMRATESHDLILDNVYVPNENFVESKRGSRPNGWPLHIPNCYLGITQAARGYAVDFAKSYHPNSITSTTDSLPTVQQNLGKMESLLLSTRHFLWSTARGYQSYTEDVQIWNEASTSKVVVMNQGTEIADLAMRIVGARSLEMSRPLQRYYRDIHAGLHNPSMEDMAYTNIAKSITNKL